MRFFPLVLFLPAFAFCQKYNTSNRGTFIISVITREGIAVGSDSRTSNFKNGDQKNIYSYFDGTQKIFSYKNIFIQVAGQYDFSKYTIWGLLNKFENENHTRVNAKTFFGIFKKYIKKYMSDTDIVDLNKNSEFIISGYIKSVPCIYYFVNYRIDSSIEKGYKSNRYCTNIIPELKNLFDTAGFNTTFSFIEKYITELSKYKTTTFSSIGGPISWGYLTKKGELVEHFQKNTSI